MLSFRNFNYQLLFDNDDRFKKLTYNIKKDKTNNNYGCFLPKKIKNNEHIISFIDKNNVVCSFIWFGIYSENKINVLKAVNKISEISEIKKNEKYIYINFSYTFEAYRNIGLNKKLRLWIESYCLTNKINYIISVPLPDSSSSIVLNKLNYDKKDNYYIKKIF